MSYQSGSLVSQYKDKDVHKAYVWGYANTQPIAEVTNADPTNIAYTSFEDKSDGNWAIASTTRDVSNFFTGLKGYSLSNGNVVKSGLDGSKTYRVTFWMRNSGYSVSVNGSSPTYVTTVNGWLLYSKDVSSTTITISGTALIDELRLYPVEAQMTSYTYDPQVGLTSATDANNLTTYYFYDTFKRLQFLKDYQGNILKRYTYNYATR